jgi:hypothetical protein
VPFTVQRCRTQAVFTTFDDDRSRSLRRLLFIRLGRSANDYFQIPTGGVVEVGTQVTI